MSVEAPVTFSHPCNLSELGNNSTQRRDSSVEQQQEKIPTCLHAACMVSGVQKTPQSNLSQNAKHLWSSGTVPLIKRSHQSLRPKYIYKYCLIFLFDATWEQKCRACQQATTCTPIINDIYWSFWRFLLYLSGPLLFGQFKSMPFLSW